jgi:predicted transcriptional regulator
MAAIDHKTELFRNILRLRRAGRDMPNNRDIVAVRADLSRELGETVSIRLAARLLGVSHTAVRRWIASGDIPTVYSRDGRVEVPVAALLDIYEEVEAERARGRRRNHILEPAVLRDRDRAERMRTDDLVSDRAESDQDHGRAERRALAYHRALGRRLRRSMVDDARHRLWQWQEEGRIDPRYARRWEEVLSRPVAEVRKAIGEDTQDGRDLRQNSPFAGMLSEAERRRIVEQVR